MLWTRLNMLYFGTQAQVTQKWIVRSDRNSNLYKILWVSWLSASLKMIRPNLKVLSSGQHFLHFKFIGKQFCRTMASNSKVNGPIWPEVKLSEIL